MSKTETSAANAVLNAASIAAATKLIGIGVAAVIANYINKQTDA